CAFIADKSLAKISASNSSPVTRSAKAARDRSKLASTAFCLADPLKPRNSLTSSRTVRFLPVFRSWAMYADTSRLKRSTVYQCGQVGSDGRHLSHDSFPAAVEVVSPNHSTARARCGFRNV